MSRKNNKVVDFFEPTLTKQSFKDDCDINKIVAKYAATGVLNHINARNPRYIDCVGVPDYQAALDMINTANEQFDALPAKIRARFGNDPEQLLAFMDDPANAEEAAKLGLIKAPEKELEKEPEKAPEVPKSAPTDTPKVADSPKV